MSSSRPCRSPLRLLAACAAAALLALACAQAAQADSLTVKAGEYNTCGQRADGTIVCFGQNASSSIWTLPTDAVDGYGVMSVPCGIDADQSVACWLAADDMYRMKGLAPTGSFSQISVGNSHVCALATDRDVVCWGDNDNGAVGPDVPGGRQVETHTGPFLEVGASHSYSCALGVDGIPQCWGLPGDVLSDMPPATDHFSTISTGDSTVCGILDEPSDTARDDTVECWGLDNHGQGASGVPAGVKFASVSAGKDHTCGVEPNGTPHCWGNDDRHQVSGLPTGVGFQSISSGWSYGCGVELDGTIACWGFLAFGQGVPEITSAAPADGRLGTAYTFTLRTTAQLPGPTWSVTDGTLPDGLTLSAGGVLSGTPREAGTFDVTFAASNGLTPDAVQVAHLRIAPTAPSLANAAAADLTTTSATLSGEVGPGGAETTYHFEWGAAAGAYDGGRTDDATVAAGTDAVPVRAEIDGLQPSTTYHFRLVATNDAGTTEGDDATFTTSDAPPPDDGDRDRTGDGRREQTPPPGGDDQTTPPPSGGEQLPAGTPPVATPPAQRRPVARRPEHRRASARRHALAPKRRVVTVSPPLTFCASCLHLTDRDSAIVRKLRAAANGAVLVQIDGYSDASGTRSGNLLLSRRRARNVAAALLGGLKHRPDQVRVAGHGEANPIASNDTLAGRAKNRRVTIRIVTERRVRR
ncbi:OmpA family protein [Conexibacter sp. CPCC 206217]|uniref:OmpA family protein n=1 Tax=Conexibacter sp. CPCC 206217 TaxID=3064574 RepID=UPI0027214508|nr:OmpA family protein [Conexibacter sp. CPCC 206217]MDO8208860.1 OmpA family protein [Conexibacter sp. CPCC 206217]